MVSIGTQTDDLCTCSDVQEPDLKRKKWKENLLIRYNFKPQNDESPEKMEPPCKKTKNSSHN